jgi:hypothetical protein
MAVWGRLKQFGFVDAEPDDDDNEEFRLSSTHEAASMFQRYDFSDLPQLSRSSNIDSQSISEAPRPSASESIEGQTRDAQSEIEAEELRRRVQSQSLRIDALETEVTEKDNDLRRLRNHLQDIQRDYETQVEELRDSNLSHLEPRDILSTRSSDAELQALQSAMSEIQREKEDEIEIRTFHLRKENATLKAQLESLAGMDEQNADLLAELKSLRIDNDFLQNEKKLNLDDIQRLKEEKSKLFEALEEATRHLARGAKKDELLIDSRVAARLIVSYISAPSALMKSQVLEVCASLLPLTKEDRIAIGLEKKPISPADSTPGSSSSSWIRSPMKWWSSSSSSSDSSISSTNINGNASMLFSDEAPDNRTPRGKEDLNGSVNAVNVRSKAPAAGNKTLGEAWIDFLLREVEKDSMSEPKSVTDPSPPKL